MTTKPPTDIKDLTEPLLLEMAVQKCDEQIKAEGMKKLIKTWSNSALKKYLYHPFKPSWVREFEKINWKTGHISVVKKVQYHQEFEVMSNRSETGNCLALTYVVQLDAIPPELVERQLHKYLWFAVNWPSKLTKAQYAPTARIPSVRRMNALELRDTVWKLATDYLDEHVPVVAKDQPWCHFDNTLTGKSDRYVRHFQADAGERGPGGDCIARMSYGVDLDVEDQCSLEESLNRTVAYLHFALNWPTKLK